MRLLTFNRAVLAFSVWSVLYVTRYTFPPEDPFAYLLLDGVAFTAFIPSFLYFFSEWARVAGGEDPKTIGGRRIMELGLAVGMAGWGISSLNLLIFNAFGAEIPFYNAFAWLHWVGFLGGNAAMVVGGAFVRGRGPTMLEAKAEFDRSDSAKFSLAEGFQATGFVDMLLGILMGRFSSSWPLLALVGLTVLTVGAVFFPMGLLMSRADRHSS